MSNWNTITSNSAFKSVGFQQILNTLGISEREVYSGITDNIINKLYKSSTNDADKEKARKILIDKLKKSFEKKWAEHKSQLDAIPMNFDFTLEQVKNIIAIQGFKGSGKDEVAKYLNYLLNTPTCLHSYNIASALNFTPVPFMISKR